MAKGNLMASLDKKQLQAELDRQLADFERIRAEFEIAAKKLGESEIDKYLKTQEQAKLNVAVKDVEIAKARLDQADLYSPVNGIIKSAGGVRPGLNITPASNAFVIIDMDSLVYRIKVNEKEVVKFMDRPKLPIPSSPGYFWVEVEIADKTNLLPGMEKIIEDSF